ncbi:hypothetical protein F5Y18DRAFT_185921 [Xylariaceae sp. FL1019]|nr:hypothetical protein F5Y18DRAFT_185921 [Xylariaceae sp. FL1019]
MLLHAKALHPSSSTYLHAPSPCPMKPHEGPSISPIPASLSCAMMCYTCVRVRVRVRVSSRVLVYPRVPVPRPALPAMVPSPQCDDLTPELVSPLVVFGLSLLLLALATTAAGWMWPPRMQICSCRDIDEPHMQQRHNHLLRTALPSSSSQSQSLSQGSLLLHTLSPALTCLPCLPVVLSFMQHSAAAQSPACSLTRLCPPFPPSPKQPLWQICDPRNDSLSFLKAHSPLHTGTDYTT